MAIAAPARSLLRQSRACRRTDPAGGSSASARKRAPSRPAKTSTSAPQAATSSAFQSAASLSPTITARRPASFRKMGKLESASMRRAGRAPRGTRAFAAPTRCSGEAFMTEVPVCGSRTQERQSSAWQVAGRRALRQHGSGGRHHSTIARAGRRARAPRGSRRRPEAQDWRSGRIPLAGHHARWRGGFARCSSTERISCR